MVARKEGIRSLTEFPFQIDLHQVGKRSLYQEFAATALHLKPLGLNTSTIACRLKREIQHDRKGNRVGGKLQDIMNRLLLTMLAHDQ